MDEGNRVVRCGPTLLFNPGSAGLLQLSSLPTFGILAITRGMLSLHLCKWITNQELDISRSRSGSHLPPMLLQGREDVDDWS